MATFAQVIFRGAHAPSPIDEVNSPPLKAGWWREFAARRVRSPRETNPNLQLSFPARLLFVAQHHDWSGMLSLLRVRAPFLPISHSRSMDLDPTEPGSNGDVRNDASIRESSRAQMAVLSP